MSYIAIQISSGNLFVHETESQVILNGNRDINFTMDLVAKDVGFFDRLANDNSVPVEMTDDDPEAHGYEEKSKRRSRK